MDFATATLELLLANTVEVRYTSIRGPRTLTPHDEELVLVEIYRDPKTNTKRIAHRLDDLDEFNPRTKEADRMKN
ncbi:hypothetical protein EVAR_54122_1 [Eumeta japonica]|uniref:Uncharacterized protein n=1 Tax=Eumeta variegata TaxID=151549 RepID=A0A4C1Z0U2_EUMVA|nr:hypothetical protein EVAR_54122_1 [Eumeta japonica]